MAASATVTPLAGTSRHSEVHSQGEPRDFGFMSHVSVPGDNSYPAGGYVVDLSKLYGTKILRGLFFQTVGTKFRAVYIPSTNGVPATGKLKIIDSTTGNEVANGVDVSSETWNGLIFGF